MYFNDSIGILVNFAILVISLRFLPRCQLCASISAYFLISAEEPVYFCRCWESLAECSIAFLQRRTSESQAHTNNPPRNHLGFGKFQQKKQKKHTSYNYQPQLGTTRWCQLQTTLSLENPENHQQQQQKHQQKNHAKLMKWCKMHLSPGRRLSRSPNCAASPWIPGMRKLITRRLDRSWMSCFVIVKGMCFKTWDVPHKNSFKINIPKIICKDCPKMIQSRSYSSRKYAMSAMSSHKHKTDFWDKIAWGSAPNFFPTAAWPIPTALMAAHGQWKPNPFAFDV